MSFVFKERTSDVALVERVWYTENEREASFTSAASSHWEMVVSKHKGKTSLTFRGPETKASYAECPADIEFVGIVLKLGTFMPHLPLKYLLNRQDVSLPQTTHHKFWLQGTSWEFPNFENADTFVHKLIQEGILMYDPLIEDVLQDKPVALTPRSIQYHFLNATGMTENTIYQIRRAQTAVTLLQQGRSILDTVYEAGYYDQAHLTRSLKRYAGLTPSHLIQIRSAEPSDTFIQIPA